MIHARMAPDGSIYEASHRAPTYPDDVPICRMWGMLEGRLPLTICADDCKLDHTGGARCVVPHEALIAERAKATADEAAIEAEVRAMAVERIAARKAAAGATSL